MNTENVSIKTFLQWRKISREMELGYARRLLLDFGKGCPYHGIQATGKKKERNKEKT